MAASNALRLQVTLDAVDRATGPFKKIMAGSKGLAKAIGLSSAALKDLKAQQERLQSFRDLKNRVDNSSVAFKAAQQRLATLRAEMAGVENPTRKASTALMQAERAATRLKTAHLGNLRALSDSKKAMAAAGFSARDLGASERKLQADIAATSATMKQQQIRLGAMQGARKRADKMHSGGMTAAAHGAGMLYGGMRAMRGAAAPVGAAMQFESAMADVRKVVDFDTPQQFAEMSRDIQLLSMRLPMTSAEISQLVAAAGQANIPRAELLGFAEDAAKMGVAFDTTAEDAGQTMATWRTAFRMGQGEVVTLADKINYLGNTGPASVQKISDVVNRIGALGEVAGLQSGPLAALGATVAGMGIQSEVSATGIKNMLLTLSSGSAATKRQREAMKAIGIDAQQMAQAMQQDAGGAIVSVLEKLGKLPKAQQAATMTALFGRESIGAIAPLLTNLDLLKTNFDKVADAQKYGGSMGAEYAARVATSENALQLAKNAAQVLAETIGATLLPTVKSLSEQVGAMLGRFANWAQENPRLAKGIAIAVIAAAALITVLGGLLIAGGMAAMAFSQIHLAVMLLSGGTGLAGLAARVLPMVGNAMMVLGRAMMANPVLLILGLIATAAFYIWQNWGSIGPKLKAIWDNICIGLGIAWDWIKQRAGALWEWLKVIFSYTPLGMIMTNWNAILTFLGGLWDRFQQIGGQLMQGLVSGLLGGLQAVGETVRNIGGNVVGWMKGTLGIRSPSRVFAAIGDNTMIGLAGGLDRSQQLPLQSVRGLGDRMRQVGAVAALGAAASPALAVDTQAPVTAAGGAPAAGAVYQITIHAGAGTDGPDIARLVRAEIERMEREKSARGRSRLSDD